LTDYLELAAGEDVDVLLEAERRGGVLRLSLRSEAGPEEDGRRRGAQAAEGDARTDRTAGTAGTAARAPARTEAGEDALPKLARRSGSASLRNQLDRELRAETEAPARVEAGGETLPELVRRSGSASLRNQLDRELRAEAKTPAQVEAGEYTLLEQVRRSGSAGLRNQLDRELRAEAKTPARTAAGEDALPELVRRSGGTGLWDRLSRGLRAEDALPDPESPWSAYAVWDAEKDSADARPALLEQLERAERTAEAAGFGAPGVRAAGRTLEAAARQTAESFPALEARGDGRWALSSSFDRRPEEDLAAEIDRSFQRDGRRYDGGFYLF